MGTLFTSTELSNEAYHQLPEHGGSTLTKIYFDCPAAWKFGDNEPTKALVDGIAAHACILEPALFAERFVRGIDTADYPLALDTNKSMEAWLKDSGIKGYSGKTKSELISRILEAEPNQQIIENIIASHASENEGKTIVKPSDFDMIKKMRATIFQNETYRNLLSCDGHFELSYIASELWLKCRWDRVTDDGIIIDYKTCISSKREEFGRSAANNGYWLKMALQHDMFMHAYGEEPKQVLLLAQSKKSPYIPKAYELTDEHLRIGREQYQAAHDLLKRCQDANSWPDYGIFDGMQFIQQEDIVPLFTPRYIAYQYGIEEESIEVGYVN